MAAWHAVARASTSARFASLRSFAWPAIAVATFLAMPMAVSERDAGDCAQSRAAVAGSMVCLGDGSLLDPSTSLVWRQAAAGIECATIDPKTTWRHSTAAESARLVTRLSTQFGAPRPMTLCVNDMLARVVATPPS